MGLSCYCCFRRRRRKKTKKKKTTKKRLNDESHRTSFLPPLREQSMSIRITYFESSSCSFIHVWSFQNPAFCLFPMLEKKKTKQKAKEERWRDDKKKKKN